MGAITCGICVSNSDGTALVRRVDKGIDTKGTWRYADNGRRKVHVSHIDSEIVDIGYLV